MVCGPSDERSLRGVLCLILVETRLLCALLASIEVRVDILEDMIVRALAVGDMLLRVRVRERCLTCGLLAFGVDSEELQMGERDGMCCEGLCDDGGRVMVVLPLSMEGIVDTMEVPSERSGGDGVCERDSARRAYRSLVAEFRVVVDMVFVDSLDC